MELVSLLLNIFFIRSFASLASWYRFFLARTMISLAWIFFLSGWKVNSTSLKKC